jgi:DNA-binding transcriptional ArsR family regulator
LAIKHGIGSTRQAISQRLALLEEVGLVRIEWQGRYKLHYLDTKPLDSISQRWTRKE